VACDVATLKRYQTVAHATESLDGQANAEKLTLENTLRSSMQVLTFSRANSVYCVAKQLLASINPPDAWEFEIAASSVMLHRLHHHFARHPQQSEQGEKFDR